MDPTKIDWQKMTTGVTAIAQSLAAATPNPIDDLLAAQIAPILVDFIRRTITPVQGFAAVDHEAAASAELAAKGLSPTLISLLLSVIKLVLPLFLTPAPAPAN